MISVNECFELIVENHNTYFKAKSVVEEIIAKQYEVELKYVLDCLKRLDDPYREDRKHIRARLLRVLCKLKELGKIEKYNKKFWRIVK